MFVERDLAITAFITDENRLTPQQPEYNCINHPDVANEVINKVARQNQK